jgi:Protein of unknown function (DUF 659)/hAT family C-terminal dimerisation region
MIVECGLPFSFFEKDSVQAFLRLLRPAYTPPKRTAVSTTLLDRTYLKIKTQVDSVIEKERYINLTLDGSDNISHDRVTNVSVGTKLGCFYYHNVTIGSTTTDATYNCEQIMQWIQDITKGKPERINSISLDTCSLQFSTFKKAAEKIPHCIMIPCNSHGLNLLTSDLIKSQWYLPISDRASAITGHMNSSNKQYQIFKEYQIKYSEKPRALATSGKTRWNSSLVKFDRINENSTALQAWKQDSRIQRQIGEAYTRKDGSQRLRVVDQALADPQFIPHLRELADLIRPIHKAMVASQADNFHIGKVLPQWKVIWDELQVRSIRTIADWDLLWPVLQDRWERQLTNVHLLAYYLLPQTVLNGQIPPQDEIRRCLKVLKDYIPREDLASAEDSFYQFILQRADFHQDSSVWLHAGDEHVFWLRAGPSAPALSRFADRLWNTLATEAASERAFSAMKLLHSDLRNRTTSEHVDKQLFIQINYRVLNRTLKRRTEDAYNTLNEDSDEETVRIEMVPLTTSPPAQAQVQSASANVTLTRP